MRCRMPIGAVFDNPDLIVACVVGDGEAETGPLATSWHSNKFLNPATDGAVLPILHLNGYKIANPTILARIGARRTRRACSIGYGYKPYLVEGDDPATMHQLMAATLDTVIGEITAHPEGGAQGRRKQTAPAWPMIVLKIAQGLDRAEGSRRQEDRRLLALAPGAASPRWRPSPDHVKLLEDWMKSYQPEELFDDGRRAETRDRRAGARRASGG